MSGVPATNLTPGWPNRARFAFTLFDDTDLMTMVNGPPVYDLLADHGLRTTKSVWSFDPAGKRTTDGSSCEDPRYRAWVLSLQEAGFEVGWHGASDQPSTRARTIEGLDRFRDIFGHDPRVGADHVGNREAMYWGPRRLTGLRASLYRTGTALARPDRPATEGEVPTSPFFWGDVLRDRIDYWRNFTFHDIDTLRPCPVMPYHDPDRPFVNWWFASTHAPTLEPFLALLAPDRLDELEARGGACIVYTHLACGFAPDGRPDPRLAPALRGLADRHGWFPTVSQLLDHLRSQREVEAPITDRQRVALERRWVADQVRARAGQEARRVLSRVGR